MYFLSMLNMASFAHQSHLPAGSFLILSITFYCSVYTANAEKISNNYVKTRIYFNSLLKAEKTAELNMFISMMPKGGDLHHHYAGAIYAETYLDWAGENNLCIMKDSYVLETNLEVINAEKKLPFNKQSCISVEEVKRNDTLFGELLRRWSIKDFINFAIPKDEHFFKAFRYFHKIVGVNQQKGLRLLKKYAIKENIQYIETMMKISPIISTPDTKFDNKILSSRDNDLEMENLFLNFTESLKRDEQLNKKITQYNKNAQILHSGLDNENFTLRFQSYANRNYPPSVVFSDLYSAFCASSKSPLIVGVNLVGFECGIISMRDYALHMKMIRYLKNVFPKVHVSLHAGEMTIGMVPPDGHHHIRDAINIAGAERIGHGVDIISEFNPFEILKDMRTKKIPVEINLTSNEIILGVKNQAHPITVYMAEGVPVVISSDDPGISRNDLTSQYVLYALRYNISYGFLKTTVFNSIRYSFLEKDKKIYQIAVLKKRFKEFEEKIGRNLLRSNSKFPG